MDAAVAGSSRMLGEHDMIVESYDRQRDAALGESICQVIGRDKTKEDERIYLKVSDAYDAVFADTERLSDILNDD